MIFHKGLILDYHVLEGYTALQDGTCCLYEETKEKKVNHSMVCCSPHLENPALMLCVYENFCKGNEHLWKNWLPKMTSRGICAISFQTNSKLIVRVSRDQWSVMNNNPRAWLIQTVSLC